MYYSKIENCYFSINKLVHSGMSHEDAWNETSIKLTKATEVITNHKITQFSFLFFFMYTFINNTILAQNEIKKKNLIYNLEFDTA